MALIGQEVIRRAGDRDPGAGPAGVRHRIARRRCTARIGLERALGTSARSTTSTRASAPPAATSRTPPSPQAFYNKDAGVKRLATETGAGQWGTALSIAGALFGLEVKVYMVRASYDQKPYRRILMETYGGQVVASPSPDTNYGRKVLAETPDSPGSLGIAISEAVEDAATRDDTKYSLGSVLNHVLLHQTVIGLEAHGADGDGRRRAGRRRGLRRRRLQLRGSDVPVRWARSSGARPTTGSSRWSRRRRPA